MPCLGSVRPPVTHRRSAGGKGGRGPIGACISAGHTAHQPTPDYRTPSPTGTGPGTPDQRGGASTSRSIAQPRVRGTAKISLRPGLPSFRLPSRASTAAADRLFVQAGTRGERNHYEAKHAAGVIGARVHFYLGAAISANRWVPAPVGSARPTDAGSLVSVRQRPESLSRNDGPKRSSYWSAILSMYRLQEGQHQ